MTGQARAHTAMITELAHQGIVAAEIARRIGLSKPYVKVLAKAAGVSIAKTESKCVLLKRRLAELACKGITRHEASAELGISYAYISALIRGTGVRFRRGYRCARRGPDQRSNQMAALYRSGQTLQEIGDQFSVTRERVRQILKKHHGITAVNGGSHIQAVEKQRKRAAKRNAKCLAKHGCTWDQYVSLRGRITKIFIQQRNNAHRRGIEWNLTLWQWWCIWQHSDHWAERGRGQGYVMCRVNDEGPYSPDNVFIALAAENSSEQKRKTSGLPRGVRKSEKCEGYTAVRNIDGKKYRLGSFPTPELAHAAYLAFVPPGQQEAA